MSKFVDLDAEVDGEEAGEFSPDEKEEDDLQDADADGFIVGEGDVGSVAEPDHLDQCEAVLAKREGTDKKARKDGRPSRRSHAETLGKMKRDRLSKEKDTDEEEDESVATVTESSSSDGEDAEHAAEEAEEEEVRPVKSTKGRLKKITPTEDDEEEPEAPPPKEEDDGGDAEDEADEEEEEGEEGGDEAEEKATGKTEIRVFDKADMKDLDFIKKKYAPKTAQVASGEFKSSAIIIAHKNRVWKARTIGMPCRVSLNDAKVAPEYYSHKNLVQASWTDPVSKKEYWHTFFWEPAGKLVDFRVSVAKELEKFLVTHSEEMKTKHKNFAAYCAHLIKRRNGLAEPGGKPIAPMSFFVGLFKEKAERNKYVPPQIKNSKKKAADEEDDAAAAGKRKGIMKVAPDSEVITLSDTEDAPPPPPAKKPKPTETKKEPPPAAKKKAAASKVAESPTKKARTESSKKETKPPASKKEKEPEKPKAAPPKKEEKGKENETEQAPASKKEKEKEPEKPKAKKEETKATPKEEPATPKAAKGETTAPSTPKTDKKKVTFDQTPPKTARGKAPLEETKGAKQGLFDQNQELGKARHTLLDTFAAAAFAQDAPAAAAAAAVVVPAPAAAAAERSMQPPPDDTKKTPPPSQPKPSAAAKTAETPAANAEEKKAVAPKAEEKAAAPKAEQKKSPNISAAVAVFGAFATAIGKFDAIPESPLKVMQLPALIMEVLAVRDAKVKETGSTVDLVGTVPLMLELASVMDMTGTGSAGDLAAKLEVKK